MSAFNPNAPRMRGPSPQPYGNPYPSVAEQNAGRNALQTNVPGTATNTGFRPYGMRPGGGPTYGAPGFPTQPTPTTPVQPPPGGFYGGYTTHPPKTTTAPTPAPSYGLGTRGPNYFTQQAGRTPEAAQPAQSAPGATSVAVNGYGAPIILADGSKLYNKTLATQEANPIAWQDMVYGTLNPYTLGFIAQHWVPQQYGANQYGQAGYVGHGGGSGPGGKITQADWDQYVMDLAQQGHIVQQGGSWVPAQSYFTDVLGWPVSPSGQLVNPNSPWGQQLMNAPKPTGPFKAQPYGFGNSTKPVEPPSPFGSPATGAVTTPSTTSGWTNPNAPIIGTGKNPWGPGH